MAMLERVGANVHRWKAPELCGSLWMERSRQVSTAAR